MDRILLETDAPDALPKLDNVSLVKVPVGTSDADIEKRDGDPTSQAASSSNESLNHPANIHIVRFLPCPALMPWPDSFGSKSSWYMIFSLLFMLV